MGMKYIIPYRKVRRQMDMESEGELVRFFIEQRETLWRKDKKVRKTEEPKADNTAAWQIYDTV